MKRHICLLSAALLLLSLFAGCSEKSEFNETPFVGIWSTTETGEEEAYVAYTLYLRKDHTFDLFYSSGIDSGTWEAESDETIYITVPADENYEQTVLDLTLAEGQLVSSTGLILDFMGTASVDKSMVGSWITHSGESGGEVYDREETIFYMGEQELTLSDDGSFRLMLDGALDGEGTWFTAGRLLFLELVVEDVTYFVLASYEDGLIGMDISGGTVYFAKN